MATTLAALVVKVGADVTGVTAGMSTLDKRLRRTRRHMKGLRDTTLSAQKAFRFLAGGAVLGFASAKVFQLGAAVDETASKFKTTLGPATKETQKFLDSFAASAGLTNQKAQDLVATTAAIAQGMGFAQRASADMAIEVTKLSADISSFNNIPIEETSLAIRAAITGERESLKRLGIVLREVDVQQRAMAISGKTVAKALTQQEKVTATMSLITERAGVAVGDLGRTMESPANRARKVVAEFLTLRDTIASKLLPAFGVVLEELTSLAGGGGFAGLTNMLQRNQGRITAWAKVTVEVVKAVATAFASLFRVAFNVGEILTNVVQIGFFTFTGQLDKAMQAGQDLKKNIFDIGDAVGDVGRAMNAAAAAFEIAIGTAEDLADASDGAAAGLNAMADAEERAAENAKKLSAMTIEENRHIAAQRDLLDETRKKWREWNQERETRRALFGGISVPGSITTRTAAATGSPELSRWEEITQGLRESVKGFGDALGGIFRGGFGGLAGGIMTGGNEALFAGVISVLGDMIGGMTSLEKTMQRNTDALKVSSGFAQRVLKNAGAVEVARKVAEAIQETLDRLAFDILPENFKERVGPRNRGLKLIPLTLDEEMEKLGISMQDVIEVAKVLNIDLGRHLSRETLEQLKEQTLKALPPLEEIADALDDVADAATEAARKLASMEQITVRALRAMGRTAQAELQGLAFGHRQELAGAAPADVEALETLHAMEKLALRTEQALDKIRAAAADQVELLQAQMRLQERELQTAQEALSAQERTVDSLTRLVVRLRDFGDSLRLGSLSPLSIPAKFAEATNQLDALRKLAVGGDVSAAESIPDAVRTMLELARAMFASGPGFVEAFNRGQTILDQVQEHFGDQLTVEEKMLAQLERQTDKLARAIQLTQKQIDAVNAAAASQIAALRASTAERMAELGRILGELTGIAISDATTSTNTGKTATNTGVRMQIAEALVREFQTAIVPSIHRGYQRRLDDKDAAHRENLETIVREFNRATGSRAPLPDALAQEIANLRTDVVLAIERGGAD